MSQYFLIGIVIGLAIYNSQLLDLRLPLAVYKKLLGQGAYGKINPSINSSSSNNNNNTMTSGGGGGIGNDAIGVGNNALLTVSGNGANKGMLSREAQMRAHIYEMLDDLSDFRPQVAKGLRDLLQYRGDVENDFCLSYQATYEIYGQTHEVNLITNGHNKPVTKANRMDYVYRYLTWMLNDAVQRQFDPFRRGFFYVCGGNALSLFRAEEIEAIVRGSDEPITLEQLKQVVVEVSPAVEDWFWKVVENMSPVNETSSVGIYYGNRSIADHWVY